MKLARQNRFGVRSLLAAAATSAMLASSVTALTGHFDAYQDPNYNFGIYAGPIGNEGVGAWTLGGNLLTRGNGYINEFSLNPTGLHQGTAVHPVVTTHFVPGLDSGAGITNGTDGYLYTVGGNGIMQVNPNNWAAPAVYMPNTVSTPGYGINTLPNGKIVYTDSGSNSNVYLYDVGGGTNTLIHTASTLIDDIETGPAGQIALAGQGDKSITVLSSTGSVISQTVNLPHYPDGLAFGAGSFSNSIYANNNDGSITRYDYAGPNFTGAVTPVDIALTQNGHHGYGDLATVGPDCAFYIGTFANQPIHGADANIATNWDNGVTNNENSIVRIGFNDLPGPDGLPSGECAFYSLIGTLVPEPASLSLLMFGAIPLLRRHRK